VKEWLNPLEIGINQLRFLYDIKPLGRMIIMHSKKTLHNSDVDGASKNVPDLKTFGDGDMFKLLSKASSESEGWMKSTKAMEIEGVGCVVQVTTQQGDNIAEALTFVPNVKIAEYSDFDNGSTTARSLVNSCVNPGCDTVK
jgi:hypothetical protein